MRERPILFTGRNVVAILEGRKTQTRRILRLEDHDRPLLGSFKDGIATFYDSIPDDPAPLTRRCPYGVVGDRLWVRETFWAKHDTDGEMGAVIDCGPVLNVGKDFHPGIQSVATPECFDPPDPTKEGMGASVEPWTGPATPGNWWLAPPPKWDETDESRRRLGIWQFLPWAEPYFSKHPSIHMPRWASRLVLEITELRIQRLHEITEEDAIAEGQAAHVCDLHCAGGGDCDTARGRFEASWDKINAKRGPWESNPWVWTVSFRRVVTP